MSVRVNLLRPDERHLYSAVGRTFMIKLAAGAAGALALLFVVLALYNLRVVVGGLASARAQWGKIEGPHAEALLVKEDLDHHLSLERELNGWSESRVAWLDPLLELQQLVPTNVQLTALNVSSKVILQPAERVPGVKANDGEDPPDEAARIFFVRVDGKAFGDMADHVVTRFVDDLRRAPTMKPWLRSLGLQGLENTRGVGDEWIFRVEAESFPRILE